MAFEEAQQLLKSQSHLSLTVLKPSISTASSHRSSLSLGMIFGDVNIDGNTNTSNKTNVVTNESADSLASSIDGASHSLPPLMTPSHVNRTSVMSDSEIKNVLIELTEEQVRRRERDQLGMIGETINISTGGGMNNNQRSPLFITPSPHRVGGGSMAFDTSFGSSTIGGFPPSSRPRSTTSITNSINSSGSGAGKNHDTRISSPLNPTRSDPLALDSLIGIRTAGHASSITASETSVNSTSQQSRIRKPNYSTGAGSGTPQSGRGHSSPYHHHHHTWTGIPPKIAPEQSFINLNHSYGHEHSTSLINASARIQNTDFASDRHTISSISHASTATSKQDSSRSVYDESSELLDTAVYDTGFTVESAVSSIKHRRESARSSTVSVASSSRPSRTIGGSSYSPVSSKRTIGISRKRSETKSNRYRHIILHLNCYFQSCVFLFGYFRFPF